MTNFVSTTGGKIVNLDSVAFLTSRTPPEQKGKKAKAQLIIGFSAASSVGGGSMMPLSLVLEGAEALDFLKQIEALGIEVKKLRTKVS